MGAGATQYKKPVSPGNSNFPEELVTDVNEGEPHAKSSSDWLNLIVAPLTGLPSGFTRAPDTGETLKYVFGIGTQPPNDSSNTIIGNFLMTPNA